jgi:hypothetical protein
LDAQRDHAQAARHVAVARHAAVAGQGNLDNDADTRNAATEAEELWDSGDRRARLAQRLSNLLGGRPEGKDAAEAILLTD